MYLKNFSELAVWELVFTPSDFYTGIVFVAFSTSKCFSSVGIIETMKIIIFTLKAHCMMRLPDLRN